MAALPSTEGSAPECSRSPASSPRAVLQGLEVKQQIISQLIDGRLHLLEAAARFQEVHRRSAACLQNTIGVPSGPTDSESVCRIVIGWVHLALQDRPEQADAISDRLESELQSHLARFGRVCLPHAD